MDARAVLRMTYVTYTFMFTKTGIGQAATGTTPAYIHTFYNVIISVIIPFLYIFFITELYSFLQMIFRISSAIVIMYNILS